MPKALKDFINQRSYEDHKKRQDINKFMEVFDPIPNVSAYHDDSTQKEVKSQENNADCNSLHNHELATSKTQFSNEFKQIANVAIYNK